jgi:hypothetical protein
MTRHEIVMKCKVDHRRLTAIAGVMALLVLTVLDGFFTVHLIGMGASEVNPLMAFYLSLNVPTFIAAKVVLTLPGLFIFLLCNNFSVIHSCLRVNRLAIMCLFTYSILVGYEIKIILSVS